MAVPRSKATEGVSLRRWWSRPGSGGEQNPKGTLYGEQQAISGTELLRPGVAGWHCLRSRCEYCDSLYFRKAFPGPRGRVGLFSTIVRAGISIRYFHSDRPRSIVVVLTARV